MAREALWVELQPLTTVYLAAVADGITQPVEHYLNTQGYDVADLVVEVFAIAGSGAGVEIRIETGPHQSATPLYDNTGAATRTSAFQEAATTGTITAAQVKPVSTVWDRTGSLAPLQRWLRWSMESLATDSIVTFRIHGVLRQQ